MDLKVTTTGTEPISSSEVKNYLKIDYTTDDSLITMLITGVREMAEQLTGRSFIAKTIEYFDTDYEQKIELPYPDHDEVTAITINGDNVLSDSIITGQYQKVVQLPVVYNELSADNDGLKITYKSLGNCPSGVKLALLKNIGELYEKRGNTFEGSVADLTENTIAQLTRFMLL